MIPEIVVQRGTNYTFIVEGGNNPSNSASYHPLYITNNPEGGAGNFLDHIGLKVRNNYIWFLFWIPCKSRVKLKWDNFKSLLGGEY